MKSLFKLYIINTASLFLISKFIQGIYFGNEYYSLFIAGGVLTMVSLLAKPIIKILILPLNLVTFGFFNWVSSAFVFYLVGLIIKDFKINYFSFSGFSNLWIDIPGVNFSGVLSYIAYSFVFSVIYSFFHWLIK